MVSPRPVNLGFVGKPDSRADSHEDLPCSTSILGGFRQSLVDKDSPSRTSGGREFGGGPRIDTLGDHPQGNMRCGPGSEVA